MVPNIHAKKNTTKNKQKTKKTKKKKKKKKKKTQLKQSYSSGIKAPFPD